MRPLLALGLAAVALLVPTSAAQVIQTHGRAAPVGGPDMQPYERRDALLWFWMSYFAGGGPPAGGAPYEVELLAKAPKDECFLGIGVHTGAVPPACFGSALEKANEVYVWGMAIEPGTPAGGDTIWFGTGANVPCLANGSLGGLAQPSLNEAMVCEYGQSALIQDFPFWPSGLGDFRPPRMLRLVVDGATQATELEDLSPRIGRFGQFFRVTTLGIRATGLCDGVVLFAGPAVHPTGAINLFAFATDGSYLGATGTDQYSNVRRFVEVDGELYAGVQNSLTNPVPGGSVLRWTGSASSPFQFEVVGALDNEVAELAVHEELGSGGPEKRLIAGTWPRLYQSLPQTDALYGLFESPPIPPGGLTAAHAGGWGELFRIDQYEPDPTVARAIASGGIASFDGYVWFGTMVTTGIPIVAWIEDHGLPLTLQEIVGVLLGTYRPLTFFRGHKVPSGGGTEFEVEVLYGMPELPVFDPVQRVFVPTPNGIEPPRSGPGGFGSFFNAYAWSLQVGQDGRLYVGTLDASFGFFGVQALSDPLPPLDFVIPALDWGADLWAFDPGETTAEPVSTRGFGNDTNSGVRNLVAGTLGLYAGTANASNLRPEGGWELVRIVPPPLGP